MEHLTLTLDRVTLAMGDALAHMTVEGHTFDQRTMREFVDRVTGELKSYETTSDPRTMSVINAVPVDEIVLDASDLIGDWHALGFSTDGWPIID